MDAEKAAVQEAAPPSKFTSSSITPPPATSDALADIREALKLYQYSGDEYTVGLSAGADHEELTEDNNSKKSLKSNEKKLIQNMKSTLEESWWKNKIEKTTRQENTVKNYAPLTCTLCCNLATKLLDNFDEKTPLFYQPYTNEILNKFSSQNFESCHNSNCYCISLLNNEYENKNEISKAKNYDYQISKCLDFTKKKTECYVCNRNN